MGGAIPPFIYYEKTINRRNTVYDIMDNICVVKFNCCSVPMIKATLKFRDKRAKDKYFSREFKDKKHIDNFINYANREWGYYLDEIWYE